MKIWRCVAVMSVDSGGQIKPHDVMPQMSVYSMNTLDSVKVRADEATAANLEKNNPFKIRFSPESFCELPQHALKHCGFSGSVHWGLT